MKKGSHKAFCKRGHAFAVTGRYKGGCCKACKDQYHKSDEYQKYHKAYIKQWDIDNKEYKDKQVREWQYKTKFGITIHDYDVMLANQDHSCAVCERPQSDFKRKFSIDHDHKTGKVRALLCDNCNHALGMVNDSPILLQKLISYLENYNRVLA